MCPRLHKWHWQLQQDNIWDCAYFVAWMLAFIVQVQASLLQCISLSCTISLTSLVSVCNAMMSQLSFCQVSGLSFCCSKFLFQTGAFLPLAQRQGNMCHFTAVGQWAKKVAVTSCSCQEEPGFIAWVSYVSSPSEVEEKSNGCDRAQIQKNKQDELLRECFQGRESKINNKTRVYC